MTEKEYQDYIDGLNLKHFSGKEFVAYAQRENSGGKAGVPPKELWENIIPTIQVLDLLRSHLSCPVKLTSIYRSEGYNKACGGSKRSYHKQFKAIDIQVTGASPSKVFSVLKKWRSAGVFKGGLGKYSTFVHIDTRGSNATW